MHYIELLKAWNKDFKIKFIMILKENTIYSSKELSLLYDNLLDSKKVIIEFKELDLKSLNSLVKNPDRSDIRNDSAEILSVPAKRIDKQNK
jgi:hypothetical protein